MEKFQKVLYVSQGLESQSDSIAQALKLSNLYQASLRGIIVCPALPDNMSQYREGYEKSLHQTVQTQVEINRRELNVDHSQVDFPIDLISSEQPAVSVIRHVNQFNYDVVIKDAEPLNDGSEGFKALDMTLLRKCPSAVWLNRVSKHNANERRVAVAIDPSVSTPEHQQLSLRLLELADSIASSYGCQLNIISCWEYQLERYLSNHVWIKIDDDELNHELEQARKHHFNALEFMVRESGISDNYKIHHIHGMPDEKIPQSVKTLDIDVLVMGTLARAGIPGFVIGNTAENVLQSVSCSLVALKPQGFVSPIA